MTQRPRRAPSKRRTRGDPDGTREAILEAARELLARDGKEGLSVVRVAKRAGVNRGTAYEHFQTREQLIEATAARVSKKLFQAVFGDSKVAASQAEEANDPETWTKRLIEFAMENPELGRVWLYELLSSRRPARDPFWRQYESNLRKFFATDMAQPGIDAEVCAVIMLAGSFLWPVCARTRPRNAMERQDLATRFAHELLRFSLHGTLRPEKFRDIDERVSKAVVPRDKRMRPQMPVDSVTD
jgi:AcrR family transcriptional regulator